jgi:hypothetical protein
MRVGKGIASHAEAVAANVACAFCAALFGEAGNAGGVYEAMDHCAAAKLERASWCAPRECTPAVSLRSRRSSIGRREILRNGWGMY